LGIPEMSLRSLGDFSKLGLAISACLVVSLLSFVSQLGISNSLLVDSLRDLLGSKKDYSPRIWKLTQQPWAFQSWQWWTFYLKL
jgi:hypothetical protein